MSGGRRALCATPRGVLLESHPVAVPQSEAEARMPRDLRARRPAPGRSGIFLTFEGIEGTGKSTQIARISAWLREQGRDVLVVREPGGTDLGEALRGILLTPVHEGIAPRAELFLYLASRAQLVAQKIRPALAAGRIVIADRYGDASIAYQGGGRTLGEDRVRSLVDFATGGLRPDRTYLLDLAPEASLARVRSRGTPDRLEGEALIFHRRVRAAYRRLARTEPGRILLLRGEEPIDAITDRIRRDLTKILTSRPAAR